MSVDTTDEEQFSAVYGYHKLAEHTILASFSLILVVFYQEDLSLILEVS